MLHGTTAEIGLCIGLLGGHRSAGTRRGLSPGSEAAHHVAALRHHACGKAAPWAPERKLSPASRRRGMVDRSGHLPTRASHLRGLLSKSRLPPLSVGGLGNDFLHQTDIGGRGLPARLCALEPRLIFPGLISTPGEQSHRSTHQQRGRHRHESVRPAPPGAAVRGGDRGLECLVDQPVVSHRQGRYGLRLFLQLRGKPLCGLANLGDVITGVLAVGKELLDLGSLGGITLAQGVCGQPGVVGVEDHLWFSFGGFRHGPRPAGRRKVVREAS